MKTKKQRLKEKADKLMQQYYLKLRPRCLVCGKPTSCQHHYFPKSMAAILRYDEENLIPLCAGCHLRLHSASDPNINKIIVERMGVEWHERLNKKRQQIFKDSIKYYEEICLKYGVRK